MFGFVVYFSILFYLLGFLTKLYGFWVLVHIFLLATFWLVLFAEFLLDLFLFLLKSFRSYGFFHSYLSAQQLCVIQSGNSLLHLLFSWEMNIADSDSLVGLTASYHSDRDNFSSRRKMISELLFLYIMGQVSNENCRLCVIIFLFTQSYSDCQIFENRTIFFTGFFGCQLVFKLYICVHWVGPFLVFFKNMWCSSAHFICLYGKWSEPYFLNFSVFLEKGLQLFMFSWEMNVPNKNSRLQIILVRQVLLNYFLLLGYWLSFILFFGSWLLFVYFFSGQVE